jgi:hypothetical protein
MQPAEFDAALFPDESGWGQGYGGKRYTAEELDDIAKNVGETKQPGYGPRMTLETPGLEIAYGLYQVPVGYDATGHPNRQYADPNTVDEDFATALDGEPQLPEPLQQYFFSRGWLPDQHGRPCHPLAKQLLGDPRIGLNAGIGYSYFYGENVVVDAVVTVGDKVLLIDREIDQGVIPALPGGYSIPADYNVTLTAWREGYRPLNEDVVFNAGLRKLRDETGVTFPGEPAKIVRAIRPISSPHTLNFWTVTYTVWLPLSRSFGEGLTGVNNGRLVQSSELTELLPRMWPDHRRALLAAIG